MLLFAILSVLTAGAVGALLWFYARTPAHGAAAAEADVAVYADQLQQIEADRERGLLNPAEAEAARAEVARRLLSRAEAQRDTTEALRGKTSARIVGASGVAVPVLALMLYAALGSPGLPDVPHAGRTPEDAARSQVAAMIARVESRLQAEPEDGNGWDVIAPIYLRMERYRDAAVAYANANRLLGETPKRLAGFAQSEILANNGIVNPNAMLAAERLLALEPQRVDARLWLGLAKEQDGKFAEALTDYRSLLQAPQMTDAMKSAIELRISVVERLARGEKVGPDSVQAPAAPAASPAATAQPADQKAMIEGMVARLADRLKTEGGDAQGWAQLVRSYMVLGRREDAVRALADARAALASNPAGLKQINDAAAEIGVEKVDEKK